MFAYVAHAERRDISDVAGQEAADLAGWIERGLSRAGSLSCVSADDDPIPGSTLATVNIPAEP